MKNWLCPIKIHSHASISGRLYLFNYLKTPFAVLRHCCALIPTQTLNRELGMCNTGFFAVHNNNADCLLLVANINRITANFINTQRHPNVLTNVTTCSASASSAPFSSATISFIHCQGLNQILNCQVLYWSEQTKSMKAI